MIHVRFARSTGTRLQGETCTYRSGEDVAAQQPLEVTPITLYNTEISSNIGNLIAVNNQYICYAIRGGMIRVINQTSVLRVLLRGHSQHVTDLAFFSNEIDLLASCGTDGKVDGLSV